LYLAAVVDLDDNYFFRQKDKPNDKLPEFDKLCEVLLVVTLLD